uniref:Uncharacterized protein n=1 Tax=Arundo donax TaxID=35708 RepID=A0A0A9BDN4_ARUDO
MFFLKTILKDWPLNQKQHDFPKPKPPFCSKRVSLLKMTACKIM